MADERVRWTAVPERAGWHWPVASPVAVVLLQHGFAEYLLRFENRHGGLVPRLRESRIAVYGFDMAGHGDSAGPRGVVDVEAEVRSHRLARRELARLGLPVFLIGHSLGGLVTAGSVLDDPDGVEGVVLSSPALKSPSNVATRLLLHAVARIAPSRGIVPQHAARGLSRRDDVVADFVADARVYRGPLPARLVSSALSRSHDHRGRYAAWKAPVLAFHGNADVFTDPDGSREFIETIGATDRTFLEVAGGAHELLHDEGGEVIVEATVSWLTSRL